MGFYNFVLTDITSTRYYKMHKIKHSIMKHKDVGTICSGFEWVKKEFVEEQRLIKGLVHVLFYLMLGFGKSSAQFCMVLFGNCLKMFSCGKL